MKNTTANPMDITTKLLEMENAKVREEQAKYMEKLKRATDKIVSFLKEEDLNFRDWHVIVERIDKACIYHFDKTKFIITHPNDESTTNRTGGETQQQSEGSSS